MKLKTLLIPFACLALANFAGADIFVLKDGSRLEARILSETSDTYRLEVLIGKSIRDEKSVPKAEVVEVIAVKPDEKEFEKIKGLAPMPDLASADEYARRMGLISKFLADHPNASKKADAESMQSSLKSEAEVISGGGIKMDGKMISGDEYQADLYDIDAKILEKRIRDAIARGDTVGALRGISKMDADFLATNSRAAVQPLKKQLLASYKEQIDELVATYEKRVAERDTNLARMSRDARVVTEQALKEEMDLADARYKADQKNDVVWVTTHPFLIDSLEETQKAIDDALRDSGPRKPEVDGGRVYRNILKFIAANNDANEIENVLSQGESAGIPERYLKTLKAAAAAKGVRAE